MLEAFNSPRPGSCREGTALRSIAVDLVVTQQDHYPDETMEATLGRVQRVEEALALAQILYLQRAQEASPRTTNGKAI